MPISTNMIDQKKGSRPREEWNWRLRGVSQPNSLIFILTLASVTHFVHVLLVFFPGLNLV